MRVTSPWKCWLLAGLLVFGSCKTSTGPSGGGGGTTFDVNGSWVTTTSLGARLTFTVSSMAISFFTLSQIPGCGSTVFGFSASAAVTSNAFNYAIPSGNPDLSGSISGTFSSATAGSGNTTITFKTGCAGTHNATWSGAKQ